MSLYDIHSNVIMDEHDWGMDGEQKTCSKCGLVMLSESPDCYSVQASVLMSCDSLSPDMSKCPPE